MKIENLTRLIAVFALTASLIDGGRLLGVGAGDSSPLVMFGVAGFAFLGTFTIARMFAAVGMWIRSTWGTSLLFGTTLIELTLFLSGVVRLDIGIIGFAARLVQLIGTILILWTVYRVWRQGIHD